MHDPLAVAVVTRPELVEFRDGAVSIVTGDGPARGVMVTDLLESADPPPANCRVAASVDADGLHRALPDPSRRPLSRPTTHRRHPTKGTP